MSRCDTATLPIAPQGPAARPNARVPAKAGMALRLCMDASATALLLLCMAYWWLDNATHEWAGAAMFGLLLAHNLLNRRWYADLPRRQNLRSTLDKVLVLSLLAAMATLLVTSVLISQTVFAAIAPADAFIARRVHLAAAYWALIIVALHIGMRWRMVLTALRRGAAALRWRPKLPPMLLPLAAAALAAAGVYGSFRLGIGDRLLARISLDGWDFGAATLAFFLHHLAVVGLYAALAYLAFHRVYTGRRRSDSPGG